MCAATATLDPPTFDYIRKLVQDSSAITLEAGKEYLVESRLAPLARQHGGGSLQELVSTLRSKPFGPLHSQVVEAMTTNETSFFRDIHPFEVLKISVLPKLLAARAGRRSLTIWSAACSSGQEPYSIAMLILEHFPSLWDWDVQILATDLSEQVLDRARRGAYTQLEVNRGLPAQLLVKYFDRQGLHWHISHEVRKRVRFLRMNLIEPWPLLPMFDLVFIRNVLIYFAPETKRAILTRMRKQMAADGTLLLGGAETTLGIDECWLRENHGKTSTYRLART
jgi:chemotaxis protein methyltransferase CheR